MFLFPHVLVMSAAAQFSAVLLDAQHCVMPLWDMSVIILEEAVSECRSLKQSLYPDNSVPGLGVRPELGQDCRTTRQPWFLTGPKFRMS